MVELHNYMLNAMTRECPPGYHAVRSEQVIKADRELWTILAQGNLKSLKPMNDVPALNQPFGAVSFTSSCRCQQTDNSAGGGKRKGDI